MPKREPFSLVYDPQVRGHLDAIDTKYHSLIRAGIDEQLKLEPECSTRNRKPLDRPIAIGGAVATTFGPDQPLSRFLSS